MHKFVKEKKEPSTWQRTGVGSNLELEAKFNFKEIEWTIAVNVSLVFK